MKLLIALFPLLLAAQAVPDDVTIEKDVVYSQGGRLMMDVARPKKPGPHPAVVAIHGGLVEGSRRGYEGLIRRLAARGYVAAAVDYRLAPRNQFPAPLLDVKAAVRFLRANAERFAIDPERVAATGDHDGGLLALLVGLTQGVAEFESGANREQSSRVSCVVSFSAPTDLTRTESRHLSPSLGGDRENARQTHVLASPLSWVTPLAPPVLALHNPKSDYSRTQSQLIVDQLERVGVTAELHFAPEAELERVMLTFLDKHLGMTAPGRVLLVADHGARAQIVAMDWPSGRELWTVPNRNGHDVQPLPNGHVLYTLGNDRKVVEMDVDHKPVWTYGPEEGLQHPISAQRLANGNTLIGDAQLGKVIEIDKDRKVVWKYESDDLAKMRMRNSRRTDAGTTLISVEAAGKIIEVNSAGEIVWSYTADGGQKRRPYKAIRLSNGNTLITLNDPGEVVEVNPAGKIVRTIGGEKTDIRMIWSSGLDVFPDGNLLVSDYQGRRILEIDKAGKVVNQIRMPTRNTASIAIVQ